MSSSRIDEARARAQAVLDRAASDNEFKQRLTDDPEETLRAEGLPDDEIGDFAREAGLGEIEGYLGCRVTCSITACTVTARY